MKRLIGYFMQGLLYLTPVVVTVYLFIMVFTWLDGLLHTMGFFEDSEYAKYSFPGLGILLFISLITLVGFLGQSLITTPLSRMIDKLLNKAPLVKIIYTSVKDLLSAFVGKERKFDTPVLINMDATGHLQRLGFITAKDLTHLGLENKVSVYLPSSYGMLGELIIVDQSQVTIIQANSAEIMKFIVSGGVTRM
jgi:Uncharacterized conserved protein